MAAKRPKSNLDVKSLVDKTSSSSVAMVIIATVIVVFCLVSAKALLAQGAYQRRVVNAKHDTVEQLKKNIDNSKSLVSSYDVFASSKTNALNGNGQAADNALPPDGSNNRIVLDALPTNYDFAALVSSLTVLLTANQIQEGSVIALDESANYTADKLTSTSPITIAGLQLGGKSPVNNIYSMLSSMEDSIRPLNVQKLDLTLDQTTNEYLATITLDTYFQPAKKVTVTNKVVK